MVIKLLSTGIKSEISLIPFFHSADPPLRIKTLLSCLYIFQAFFLCVTHLHTHACTCAHIRAQMHFYSL